MTSRSEAILNAIATALAATSGVSGRIYRDRYEAVSRGEMPALVILPLSESDQILTSTETLTTTLSLTVDVLINGAPLSTLADPIRVSLHSLLMAANLGPGVISCYPDGRDWDAEPGEIGVVRCRYRVSYRTTLASIE